MVALKVHLYQFLLFKRYDGPNMATTYEQHESEEDGDPWKDSTPTGSRISSDLIEKSM